MMFQEGNYDVLEFNIPSHGMNRNVAPDELPFSFAYILENFVPHPLGEGIVRFGTRDVLSLPNQESKIIKTFPFLKEDGSEQLILYVQEYTEDLAAKNFSVDSSFQFSFESDTPKKYIQDTAVKVEYELHGTTKLYETIKNVAVAGKKVSITLSQNSFAAGSVIKSVSFSSGTLYSYTLSTKTLSGPLRQNLSVGCIPRSATFLNTLILCNGVDPLLSWNGTHLSEVTDFVKEDTAALIRIDARHFSFTIPASFNIVDYTVGNLLQIRVMGVTTQTAIAAVNLTAQTLTVTTTTDLPNFIQNQTQILYQAWPPRFSFLYVAHDRLWALGEGASGLGYRANTEALTVYYTQKTNTISGWFNEKTKTLPSIDLSKKHGEPDNLEAICMLGGLLAFVGRKKTQIYQGTNPLPSNEGGDFSFNSILPTGCVHGDLLIELPNDVFFVSSNGLQSFSTLNVAKQFSANSYDAVDPLIKQYVTMMMESNASFRQCSAFKYDHGSLAGFKFGYNKVLCSLFSTSFYAWSLFSGDFEWADGFLSFGNSLYIFEKSKLRKYADGNDGLPPLFGDKNGKDPISFSWILPVLHTKGHRFANKFYEVRIDYPSSFVLDYDSRIEILASGDLSKSFRITDIARFDMRGDAFSSIPLANLPVSENSYGFRFEQPYRFFKNRFQFVSSHFWLSVKGMTKTGPIVLKKIKLFGITERR